jgi:Mat/Ecp fimbriae outer membrane usher protein
MFRQFTHRQPRYFLIIGCFCGFLSTVTIAQNNLAGNDNSLSTPQVFVDEWLVAWERQDLETYFLHYHADFEPSNRVSVDVWRETRTRNISRPSSIDIEMEEFEVVQVDANDAVIRLWFTYQSPTYADRTWKELVLTVNDGGDWGIINERNLEVERLEVSPQPASAVTLSNSVNVEVVEEEPQIEAAVEDVAEVASVQDTEAAVEQAATPALASARPPESSTASSSSTSTTAEWVPPGFEDLNQPQVTEIDVFYGGYYLTSVLAQFNDTEVSILDRANLVENLINLKNPEAFDNLLKETMDAHAELLCYSDFQVDCGSLVPESVGIIFDRARLRLQLFISSELLLSGSDDQIRFLPASDVGLSFLNQSAAYFSGQDASVETYNVFNNTLFAWGENRLSLRSNLISDEGLEVDTVAFMREFQGKDYRAGLFRESANGFSFMTNERMAGVSFGSSLLTRTDLERSLGTEIELFFATRSRVEIYREGRLISTDYYNVGNHLLDTSTLPNGSYSIELKIIDAGGGITTEERFYSKTSRIAPADQPLYFLHIGRLRNEQDLNRLSRTGEDVLIRGGYNLRLGQSLGGSLGFSVVDDTSFVEAGLFKQGQNFELQANVAYEDTGAAGADLRFRYRHPNYNLTFNSRQVFNGIEDSQIGLDYRQYNSMLEVPTRLGYLSVFHRHVKRPLTGKDINTGLRFRTRSRPIGAGNLTSSFELSSNDDEIVALLSFSYQLQENNKTSSYSPKLSYSSQDSNRDSGLYGAYESSWYLGEQSGNEYQLSLRGDYDDQSSLEARFEADTRLGSSDIVTRYNQENQQVEFSGRISTSYATNGQMSGFGGKRRSESAFLIKVEGDTSIGTDAQFNVIINGVVRGQTRAGETLLLPVAPYETYEIELQSVGDTLVSLDSRIYRETMYPGNVVNLSWATQVINIAIGRLVDADGEPMSNAVIRNVVGIAITDDAGYFQAEVEQGLSSFEVQKGLNNCSAEFENPQVSTTVFSLGTLVCR